MVQAVSNSLDAVLTPWSEFRAWARNCANSGMWVSTSDDMTSQSQPSMHICFKSSFFCIILSKLKKPLVLSSASEVLQEASTALRKVTKWLLETEANLSQPNGPHSCWLESSAKDLFACRTFSFSGTEVGNSKHTDSPILAIEKPICAIAAPLE